MSKKHPKPQPVENFLPSNTYFSFLRLQQDQHPSVPCERLVQMVIKDGVVTTYVTESAYIRDEALQILDRLLDNGYEYGLMKEKATMVCSKDKIHWRELTPALVEGNPGPRVDPETGEEYK